MKRRREDEARHEEIACRVEAALQEDQATAVGLRLLIGVERSSNHINQHYRALNVQV